MFLDSNGPVTPVGSKTLIADGTYSSDYWATVIASFKPADAVAFDNATSADTSGTSTTLTFAHRVAVGGTNRLLFVGVVTYATSISSATYNGTTMTLIGSTHEIYNNTYT